MSSKQFLVLITFFYTFFGFAQYSVTGKIVDATTKKPIPDASIYFDGTTIGTISNSKGTFELNYENATKAALTISSMAYETLRFQVSEKQADLGTIILNESTESLDAVMLETDPWTRKQKLNYFRNWFLGFDFKDKRCEVLNEDDLHLRFNPSTKKLTASASKPLIIENKYLGYKIIYQLEDFQLDFEEKTMVHSKDTMTHYKPYSFFYLGASYFQELKGKSKKKYEKRREEIYPGSATHLMRAIANKELKKKGYRIFYGKYETPHYQYINVESVGDIAEVQLLTPLLTVLYNNNPGTQSFIQIANNQLQTTFYIDQLGNFYPPNKFYFGGYLGFQRVSSMLPLDYGL